MTMETVSLSRHLPSFQALPPMREAIFSTSDAGFFPAGDDDNACTRQDPCAHLDRANEIAAEGHVHIILDTGDADAWDTVGEWDGAGAAVQTGRENSAFALVSTGCTAADLAAEIPCVVISGADPTGTEKAIIDCAGHDPAVNSGNTTHGTVDLYGPNAAIYAFENIEFRGCPPNALTNPSPANDIFRVEPGVNFGIKTVRLNTSAPDIQGQSDQLYTTHGNNAIDIGINDLCEVQEDAIAANHECIRPASQNNFGVYIGGTYINRNDDTAYAFTGGDYTEFVAVDVDAIDLGTAADATKQLIAFNPGLSAAQENIRIFVANARVRGWKSGHANSGFMRPSTNVSSDPSNYYIRLFKLSLHDLDGFLKWPGVATNSKIDVVGSNLLIPDLNEYFINAANGGSGNCDQANIVLTNVVSDDDAVTNTVNIEGTDYTSFAAAQTGSQTQSCGFDGTGWTLGVTDSDAAEYAIPTAMICDTAGDCYRSASGSMQWTLLSSSQVPAFVYGRRVDGFFLDATGTNIGAD